MKKSLKFLMIGFILLCTMFVFTACESPIVDIVLDTTNFELTVPYNTDLDFSDLIVKAKRFNGKQSAIDMEDENLTISCPTYSKTTPGSYLVTVTYTIEEGNSKTKTFNIVVASPVETGFRVDSDDVTKVVSYGTALDLSGLQVYSQYEHGAEIALTNGNATNQYAWTCPDYSATTSGAYTVTIAYKNYATQTFSITVNQPTENGFEVDTSELDLSVDYGTDLDLTGLIVEATYAESAMNNTALSLKTVDEDGYEIDNGGYNENQPNTYTITVSYKEYEDQTFEIIVEQAKETGFVIDTTLVVKNVDYGTELDLAGLVVKATYQDGTFVTLNDTQYTMTNNYNKEVDGIYTIRIDYKTYTQKTFTITVGNPSETGFEVDSSTVKKNYGYNEDLDLTGLVVEATYNSGSPVQLSVKTGDEMGYEIDNGGFNKTTPSTYTITISYKTYDAVTFDVTVAEAQENGFEVDTSAIDTSVEYGDTPVWTDLVVRATYQDNTKVTLTTSDYTLNNTTFNADKQGTYTITVSYGSYDDITFDVTVGAPAETGFIIDTNNVVKVIEYDTEIDLSTLVVYATYEDPDIDDITISKKTTLNPNGYEVDLGGFSQTTVGVYTITISYKSYQAQTFTVEVKRVLTGDNYIVDTDGTIVLFSNVSYTFTGATNISLTNNTTQVVTTVTGSTLAPMNNGYYTMNYTNTAGDSRTKNVKVVDYLTLFAVGSDYTDRVDSIESGDYIKTTVDPYLVGIANDFIFDINAISAKTSVFTNVTTDYVNFKFYVKNELEEFELTNAASIVSVTDGYKFRFNEAYVGKTVKMIATAKYQTFSNIEFIFILNNGYNVFTHSDLVYAFSNRNVASINVHREIVAVMAPEQLNPNGTPRNVWASAAVNYVTYDQSGAMTANATANLYVRIGGNTDLVINGNYFDINGKNLPKLRVNSAESYTDQPNETLDIMGKTEIINSQSSIFYFDLRTANVNANYTSAVENNLTRAQFNELEPYKVTFNNLTIMGSTVTPTGDMTDEEQQTIIYQNSGSHAGIMGLSDYEANNVNVGFCVIAIFVCAKGADVDLTDCHLKESWANNIYGHGSSYVTLQNCFVENAGGAAVWLEDIDLTSGDIYDPHFVMDAETNIDNYVSGTEAWFVAYQMQTFVPAAKSGIEGAVNTYSQNTKTILVEKQDSLGGTYETFNFAVVILDKYTGTPTYRAGYTYEDINVSRVIAEFNQDIRKAGGRFMCVVDQLADTVTFLTAVSNRGNEIYGLYVAENIKYTTAVNGYMSAYGVDVTTACGAIAAGELLYSSFSTGRYLEINQSVEGLGNLTLITEFFPV